MHPILFEAGGLTIYSYGVLLAAAYLLGLQFALMRARARGLPAQQVMDLGIWIIISALVGAKLLLLIVDFDQFTSNPRDLLSLARSGGVFYGGLIAAVAVALVYLRRHKLPLWTTTDVFAPGIALGHIVGRFGCLLAGCCFGKPASVPWAITFTDPAAMANVGTPLGVPLHPTQLYDAGAEALILTFLLLFERRGRPFPGRTFWSYMLLYGASRFVIEFYRGDNRGMVFGALSTSQFVSILLVPLSIVMLVLLSRRIDPTRHRAAQRVAA
ncbi:MAG TPA: prolipoprotein diacylglyceryl transferase [Vicinamibacterales bacterium]|nr:prolipoprotein diacylglyceryl transferase [Vicinamibacterales bacterium]